MLSWFFKKPAQPPIPAPNTTAYAVYLAEQRMKLVQKYTGLASVEHIKNGDSLKYKLLDAASEALDNPQGSDSVRTFTDANARSKNKLKDVVDFLDKFKKLDENVKRVFIQQSNALVDQVSKPDRNLKQR